MRIQIITSCTGEKAISSPEQLTQEDFRYLNDQKKFTERESRLSGLSTKVEDIYTGQQHIRLMKGIRHFQERGGSNKVDLWVLSAGYGLVRGDKAVVPYECTFQNMSASEASSWSEHLNIPAQARKAFKRKADLTIVLLGEPYLKALKLDDSVEFKSPTLFFTSDKARRFIKGKGAFSVIPLSNKDTKRFSCGLVGLKGELAKRLLQLLVKDEKAVINGLFNSNVDVLLLLESAKEQEDDAKAPARLIAIRKPDVDKVIDIPKSWWAKPHRSKLRYFIPEWDDRVDRDFDFETDTHSGGLPAWSNEVYAHQLYPEPNYDGILISKIVAESDSLNNEKISKRERINQLGVHRYLRVPAEFPIMGDCGAFGYIGEDNPPYTTPEILEYYTRLGFNYGVSIDHLIVKATESQRQHRYELTIHNAEEFLREHKKLGLLWEPIGALQGWDPVSYAEAARQYVAMGYGYIALGGLVRSSTKDILKVLDEVHKVVPPSVSIHLFGIARTAALKAFTELGVRSVDSASHLRRAWLGAEQNYFALDGNSYAAIRIPGMTSFRVKRMIKEGRAEREQVFRLQKACITAMKDFDSDRTTIDIVLDTLDEYDSFIDTDRKSHRSLYRKTLEARPWKECPCCICSVDGVQVIIFRGNDRNRRRGFHNTYVFYNLIDRIFRGEQVEGIKFQKAVDPQINLFASMPY